VLGYNRSLKNCKGKFKKVHKYYKKTKDGRASRQDGKNSRFFAQLESLYGEDDGSGSGGRAVCYMNKPTWFLIGGRAFETEQLLLLYYETSLFLLFLHIPLGNSKRNWS
jgi:hypothetical protein